MSATVRLALVTVVVALLPACLVGGGARDWELSDVDAASVRLTNGQLLITSEQGRETAWVAYDGGGVGPQAVQPTVVSDGGMLWVDAAGGLLSGGELSVDLPAGVPIEASVDAGDLAIELDAPSHVRACVDAGSLTIEIPAGAYALDLHGVAGDVRVDGIVDDPSATYAIQARVGAGSLSIVGVQP